MNTEKNLDIVLKEATSIVAQRNAELMKSISTEGISFSENFKERMNALFERARVIERRLLIRKRIAVALIAALIAALTACTCIPSVRERVYKAIINNAVITYFEKYFTVEYPPENDDGYERPQFVAKAPTYVPEGYELIRSSIDGGSADYYYEKENLGYISYSQEYISTTSSRQFDNEGVIIHEVKVGENEAFIIEHIDYVFPFCLIYWNDEIYEYTIVGAVTVDEMLIIAISVR